MKIDFKLDRRTNKTHWVVGSAANAKARKHILLPLTVQQHKNIEEGAKPDYTISGYKFTNNNILLMGAVEATVIPSRITEVDNKWLEGVWVYNDKNDKIYQKWLDPAQAIQAMAKSLKGNPKYAVIISH